MTSSDCDSDYQEFQCGWCDSVWMGKVMWPCDGCGERACQYCQDQHFHHIGCAFGDDFRCVDCWKETDPQTKYCDDPNCTCGNNPPEREQILTQRRSGRQKLDFGKYRGQYLVDLSEDPMKIDYVRWLASLQTRPNLADWEQKVLKVHTSFVQEAVQLIHH